MSETTSVVAVVPPAEFNHLASHLKAAGIRVRSAENFDEVSNGIPRVVLCDADSHEWRKTLTRLRSLDIPVIFLTCRPDEQLWLEMLQAGAYDLLDKGCRPAELQWAVTSALGCARVAAA